jgi:oligosaccharide repeat unit polymerase
VNSPLVLTTVILIVLAVVNYRLDKSLFYPSTVWCLVWAADLILLAIAGDFFYPITIDTLGIIVLGAFSFSLGCAAVTLAPTTSPPSQPDTMRASKLVTWGILGILLLTPFVLRYFWQLADAGGLGTFFVAIRGATLEQSDQENMPAGNVMQLAFILAIIAALEDGKWRKRIAIALALILNAASGARSIVIWLVLSLICVDWLKTRRIRVKPLAWSLAALLVIFTAFTIYLGKGDTDPTKSIADNAQASTEVFALYAAGPVVALDRTVREPGIVPLNWHIDRFFLQTANKLGGRFDVPSLHAAFIEVGPYLIQQNVYTCYWAYLEYGVAGVFALCFGIGFIVTAFYRQAIKGHRMGVIMYASLFPAIIFSIFNENFLLSLNTYLKLYAVAWVTYSLPGLWARCRGLWVKRVNILAMLGSTTR